MLRFSVAGVGDGAVMITAHLGGGKAGSVAVREHNPGQVAAGRLHVAPGCRGQRIARQLMDYVLAVWQDSDIWLYAEPYTASADEPAGPPREVLERFYMSLGFEPAADASGRAAMVRHASRRFSRESR